MKSTCQISIIFEQTEKGPKKQEDVLDRSPSFSSRQFQTVLHYSVYQLKWLVLKSTLPLLTEILQDSSKELLTQVACVTAESSSTRIANLHIKLLVLHLRVLCMYRQKANDVFLLAS